jgi:hypothetical protein
MSENALHSTLITLLGIWLIVSAAQELRKSAAQPYRWYQLVFGFLVLYLGIVQGLG